MEVSPDTKMCMSVCLCVCVSVSGVAASEWNTRLAWRRWVCKKSNVIMLCILQMAVDADCRLYDSILCCRVLYQWHGRMQQEQARMQQR